MILTGDTSSVPRTGRSFLVTERLFLHAGVGEGGDRKPWPSVRLFIVSRTTLGLGPWDPRPRVVVETMNSLTPTLTPLSFSDTHTLQRNGVTVEGGQSTDGRCDSYPPLEDQSTAGVPLVFRLVSREVRPRLGGGGWGWVWDPTSVLVPSTRESSGILLFQYPQCPTSETIVPATKLDTSEKGLPQVCREVTVREGSHVS